MAKLIRANQKVFGENVGAVGNFGVFGSLANGSPQYSKDAETIQSLDRFKLAFAGAVVGNKSPAFEDINSLFFLAFRQLAYLFQQGIAEWHAETEYTTGSRAMVSGAVYVSKQDTNLNHSTADTNWWMTEEDALYVGIMKRKYPIGELYLTRRSGDPSGSEHLGFGSWVRWGQGTFAVSQDDSVPWASAIQQTGGVAEVALTMGQMPRHRHDTGDAPVGGGIANSGFMATSVVGESTTGTGFDATWSGTEPNVRHGPFFPPFEGNNEAHNNLPPYCVMWYSWVRTA